MSAGLVAAEWLSMPLLLALSALPGAGLAALLSRRVAMDRAEFAGWTFALSVSVVSALATVWWYAGIGLTVLAWACVAGCVAGAVLLVREWRAGLFSRLAPSPGALPIALAAGLVAMLQRPWFHASSDIFYHVAAVRSLLTTGRVLVTDPIYGTVSRAIDPTSGIWHTMQGCVATLSGIEPTTLYLGAMGIGAAVLALGAWSLLRRVTSSPVAIAGGIALMFVGLYRMDLRVAAYPNIVSYGLAMMAIALYLRLLEDRSRWTVALAALATFATVSMHVGSAELVGLAGAAASAWAIVAWLATRRREGDEARYDGRAWLRIAVALAAGFGAAAPVLIPRLAALSGSSVIGESTFGVISDQVVHLPLGMSMMLPGGFLGPGSVLWTGSALAAWAAWRAWRRRDVAALGAFAVSSMAVLLLVFPPVATVVIGYSAHMARRLAKLLQFAPYVSMAWALGLAVTRWPSLRRTVAWTAGCLVALSLVSTTFVGTHGDAWLPHYLGENSVLSAWKLDRRAWWGSAAMDAVRREVGASHPVVAGDPVTSYQLCGMLPVYTMDVLESHSPYFVEVASGKPRRADATALMATGTSEAGRRAILAKWGVSYVVADPTEPADRALPELESETTLFQVVVDTPHLVLLKVRP
jgi:hypothetical protein